MSYNDEVKAAREVYNAQQANKYNPSYNVGAADPQPTQQHSHLHNSQVRLILLCQEGNIHSL
jgi:hypothetical protein